LCDKPLIPPHRTGLMDVNLYGISLKSIIYPQISRDSRRLINLKFMKKTSAYIDFKYMIIKEIINILNTIICVNPRHLRIIPIQHSALSIHNS